MSDITTRRNAFIARAIEIHSGKYTYESVDYVNMQTKVQITCLVHGPFTQVPRFHINGQGCKQCANQKSRLSIDEFINRSTAIHNSKYDYSRVEPDKLAYATLSKITIICPTHGEFEQRVHDHLQGHGCKKCSSKTASNKALSWLDHITEAENVVIQHAGNGGEFNIPGTKLFADGYCETTNTVYEFDGDAYHGNPIRYQPTDRCHPYDKTVTAADLLQATHFKHNKIRALGFQLVTIWESDFDRSGIAIRSYDNIVESRKDPTYYLLLEAAGLKLIDEYRGAKQKHRMQCLVCGDVFRATLISKVQVKRKRPDVYGCPKCNKERADHVKRQSSTYPDRLAALGYLVEGYVNASKKVHLTCAKCGREKHVTASAVIQRNVRCCEE
mgnify:CR=1 FL=1